MRQKKWIDCPVCGAKHTMKKQTGIAHRFHPRGYPPVDIEGLDGQFCESCGDGFWSLKSEKTISRALGEHMAKEDAGRLVANELASVPEVAEHLKVSRQAVHKMMDEGRLRYVQTRSLRLPVRASMEKLARQSKSTPGPASNRRSTSARRRAE
jgi:excisionase family DNA binding protein